MSNVEGEYLKLYKKYSDIYGPNTCIFYMVGKFYEMYDSQNPETGEPYTSIQAASELLNIQMSTKQDERGKTTYFAGIPEHVLHKYAAVLTRNNWTVIVCDQVKDAKGKVVDRPVVRILSPGTHYETATADAPFVGAVWLEERQWQQGESPAFATTFFDLTTGLTTGFQGLTTGTADVWSADLLVQAMQVHNPREVLIFWRGDSLSRPSEAVLRSRLGGTQALFHIRQATSAEQGAFEKSEIRQEFLQKHFAPQSMLPILEYLNIREVPLVERALIALLRFMEDHLPSALENLRTFVPWIPKGRVHLGNNALTQLNITSMRNDDSVLGIFNKTLSAPGKRAIRSRLLTPITDVAVLQARLNKVEALYIQSVESQLQIEKYLRQLYDFPRIHRRVQTFSINAADVLQLDTTYGRITDLSIFLNATLFEVSAKRIQEFEDVKVSFSELFDLEKAKQASDDLYFFKDTVAPKTAAVEKEIQAVRDELQKKIKDLAVWAGLQEGAFWIDTGKESQAFSVCGNKKDLTQLKQQLTKAVLQTQKDDKLIKVTGKATSQATSQPEGCPLPNVEVNLKKTGGGNIETTYLEVIHYKVTSLRQKLHAVAKEELGMLCQKFIEASKNDIWTFLETWVADLDITQCVAKVSQQRCFRKPELIESTEESIVEITGLRHPLIENASSRIQYVQHDVHLGTQDNIGWLVYGMNASGKSSLMKAVGIAVILAQTGCFVPAISMKLAPFRSVLTRILNQDNLWAGLSSFAVEMTELRDILKRADPFSLILGDELCSGTESISATALVASGVQHLLKKKSRFIFATHLHGLLDIPTIKQNQSLQVWHLKVRYDAGKDILIYDRSLHKGPGSSLYGIEVAKALHLPPEFLETALQIRKSILGEKSEEDSSPSSWNASVIRKECSACGKKQVRNLEVHHIRERSEANGMHFADGSSRDAAANLAVLCEECHDKVHAKQLTITPLIQTSVGSRREPATGGSSSSPEKDDRLDTIMATLRKYPNTPVKRLVYELETNDGVQTSEMELRKLRKRGESS